MKESTITKDILNYLKKIPGCFAWKEHGGGYSQAGIPDIICCYKGRFVAFEVKTETGRLSKLQEYALRQINNAGGTAVKVTSLTDVIKILEGLND
jgi:Holliday junction resolvase